MRQMIVFVALLAAIGGGAYLYLFKKKEVTDLLYPPAKDPLEAIEKFRSAIKSRNFELAARYCTTYYASVLTRSHKAAKEQGDIVDDLRHRLDNDGLNTSEMRNILNALDPFPTDLTMAISEKTDRDAVAIITVPAAIPADWQIDNLPTMSLYSGLPASVRVVKEGSGDKVEWKLDFDVPASLQVSATKLNDHYKDVVNALKVLTNEVKTEPTTKENVRGRMKTLLEEAARNPA